MQMHIHCISVLKELNHQVLNYTIYVTRAPHVYRCKTERFNAARLFSNSLVVEQFDLKMDFIQTEIL